MTNKMGPWQSKYTTIEDLMSGFDLGYHEAKTILAEAEVNVDDTFNYALPGTPVTLVVECDEIAGRYRYWTE